MQLIIIGVIAFAFSFWFIVHTSKKKSHRERLSSTQRMAEMQLRQMDVLRQRNTIREDVDRWRTERNLRPIYRNDRPAPIGNTMRNNGDGNGWIEDREDPRYVPEYLRINFNKANPKEGDIREECIIANQPEKGVRVYEFRSGRWHLRSTLHAMPDFLTEEDVLL